jgi:hypothetical protein
VDLLANSRACVRLCSGWPTFGIDPLRQGPGHGFFLSFLVLSTIVLRHKRTQVRRSLEPPYS